MRLPEDEAIADLKKLEHHNWSSRQTEINDITVRLLEGNIPHVEMIVKGVDGVGPDDIISGVAFELSSGQDGDVGASKHHRLGLSIFRG